jgi:hypothetical protein
MQYLSQSSHLFMDITTGILGGTGHPDGMIRRNGNQMSAPASSAGQMFHAFPSLPTRKVIIK